VSGAKQPDARAVRLRFRQSNLWLSELSDIARWTVYVKSQAPDSLTGPAIDKHIKLRGSLGRSQWGVSVVGLGSG
jgi:hypothetical protein